MSLPASMYTQPGGGTPQGQQVAQGMPNQANSVAPPNPMASNLSDFPSDQALSGAYAGANANLTKLGTADTRQEYITNSALPGMQTNYDDLAKKLFEYDQGTLSPQFQGQNPGTPSDAPSFGRVDASPLGLTAESAGLPASSGLFNNNPKYGYTAQTAQANNLGSLLETLNRGIGDTLGARMGTYRSDRQAAQDALDSIFKIMGLKQTVASRIQDSIDKELDREAARANAGGLAGKKLEDAKSRLLSDAKKGSTFTDLVQRYVPDGLSPSEIREMYNQTNYYGKPATESEQEVSSILNGAKPAGQLAKEKADQVEKDKVNSISSVLSLKDSWDQVPEIERITGIGSNYSSYNSQKQIIGDNLAKTFGISRSNPAITRLLNTMPSSGVGSSFSQGKFQGALDGLLVSQGYMLVKDKASGDIGTIKKSEFNKSKYEEVK